MKLYIHDLPEEDFGRLFSAEPEDWVVRADSSAAHCIGCFHCWTKHPGRCFYPDAYRDVPALIGHADELVLVSKLWHGSYSPQVKGVLDRSIGFTLPFFTKREGEMHHVLRYDNDLKLTVLFYGGEGSEEEQELARGQVQRNAVNLDISRYRVRFAREASAFKEAL